VEYEPKFTITPRLLGRVEAIAGLRARILGAAIEVPWIPALQKDTRSRNAHSSTAIEGNPLTLAQVQVVAAGRRVSAISGRSRREVLNYFAALRFVEKHAQLKIVTDAHLCRLHHIMAGRVMDQGHAGRYRAMRVRVGDYIPPPPAAVPGLMFALLDWWNRRAPALSPVLSSAILHYRFEAIHPFADGNGRTGRVLALWELFRRGFDSHHIFSVDEFYWEDRPRYYDALAEVERHGGDLTAWLDYAAEGLQGTLERVWRRMQDLAAAAQGRKLTLRPRQEELLALLRERGPTTPAEIWKYLKISKQGAMDLLHPLLKAGLVVRVGTKRTGYYRLKQ